MHSDYLDVFEKLHLEGPKRLSWGSLMKSLLRWWWMTGRMMSGRWLGAGKIHKLLSHRDITQNIRQSCMLLYVLCSQRMVCGLQSLFVQNVKFSIVFNVTLFWLIQECKGALPEMPPGTGSLVWLWRNLWNLPGTAATIPLSMLLCNLILCHFEKNCLQPILQYSPTQQTVLKI